MLFNSAQFLLVFLPVALCGFFFLGWLGQRSLAIGWLAIASLVFYGWDDPSRLLPLILCSIAGNFVVSRMMTRWPRPMLCLGVVGNLALLAYFKYAGFLVESFNAAAGAAVPNPQIALPIGISFYTFTQIAFLVDTFRRQAQEYNPLHYLLFVSFFPHLIAGPIYHHREIIPQFAHPEIYRFDVANLSMGMTWLALGLAKKVLLADSLAQFVGPAFARAAAGASLSWVDSWVAVVCFALQLYYDFSGYSDMAIGLALTIGVRFPLNFNSPYKATSLIDFWRRWHMTLSRFLRDYLYIPLGGNRKGPARRYANLIVTMLLGGLWHGAGWNFVIWGGLHGVGLTLNHLWRGRGLVLPAAAAQLLTLVFVMFAWVPFRAETLDATLAVWAGMAGLNGLGHSAPNLRGFLLILGSLAVALFAPNTQQLLSYPADLRQPLSWQPKIGWAITAGALFGAAGSFIITQQPSEFLYFRF